MDKMLLSPMKIGSMTVKNRSVMTGVVIGCQFGEYDR